MNIFGENHTQNVVEKLLYFLKTLPDFQKAVILVSHALMS